MNRRSRSPQRHSPDFDCYFVIVAMDLLSALVEALGASCQGALEAGKAAQLAMACVADDMPDIRQCGFRCAGPAVARLGSWSTASAQQVAAHLATRVQAVP